MPEKKEKKKGSVSLEAVATVHQTRHGCFRLLFMMGCWQAIVRGATWWFSRGKTPENGEGKLVAGGFSWIVLACLYYRWKRSDACYVIELGMNRKRDWKRLCANYRERSRRADRHFAFCEISHKRWFFHYVLLICKKKNLKKTYI